MERAEKENHTKKRNNIRGRTNEKVFFFGQIENKKLFKHVFLNSTEKIIKQ